MTPVHITIDEEFELLIQQLAEQELVLLTEQILRDGCREPLSVWKTEDDQRILLDGHNRYKICGEHKRDFQTINIKLDSREQAKLWILEHQVGRRNLTDDQRAVIWNEIREQRSKVASEEGAAMARAAKADSDSAKSAETTDNPTPLKTKRDTRQTVANESKISESKLRKLQQLKKTNPGLYEAVRTGKVTLRDARRKSRDDTKAKQALVKPKKLKTRYTEKDFYARIARGLDGAFNGVKDRLDELTHIKESDWSPNAEVGLQELIKSLNVVAERVDEYTSQYKTILKSHKKAV
jgi:hypothetical protein